jgi:hypothetical protein
VFCNEEEFGPENMEAYKCVKFLTLKKLKEEYHKYHLLNFDEKCPYKLRDLKNAFMGKIGDKYKSRHSTTIYKRKKIGVMFLLVIN